MSVLLGSLVTIGVLTKNSELIVMKACGISLYRMALPMLAGALLAGGTLFALEQTTLGHAEPEGRRASRRDERRIAAGTDPPQPAVGARQPRRYLQLQLFRPEEQPAD